MRTGAITAYTAFLPLAPPQEDRKSNSTQPQPGGRGAASAAAIRAESAATVFSPSQTDSETINYQVPLGETGPGQLRSPSPKDSLRILFQFENTHATAQRHRALARGEPVKSQNIRIKTAVTLEGEIIAVAGVTETIIEDSGARDAAAPREEGAAPSLPEAAPRDKLIRELAYVADQRRLIIASGSAFFGMSQRPMPEIRHAGTAASAMRVMRNRAELRRETDRRDIFSILRSLSTNELETLLKEFEPLERALEDLQQALSNLEKNGGTLTALSARGGDPVVKATVESLAATVGEYRIRVDQTATAQMVEATRRLIDGTPLELLLDEEGELLLTDSAYTFTINGVEITVSKDDTLPTLVQKINYGEDLNRNGVLDSNSPYFTEEDANANGKLDGGTVAHGVRAAIADGHLRLTAADPGFGRIQVTDPDGLLEALGLVEEDAGGMLVFTNEIAPSSSAIFTIDERELRRPANTVSDAIAGVRLELLQPGEETVTISIERDGQRILAELENLVAEFNRVIRAFNRALDSNRPGLLRNQEKATRVYRKLIRAASDPVPGQPNGFSLPAAVGLALERGPHVSFTNSQLDTALAKVKNGNRPLPTKNAKSPPSVFNALDEIGITVADNNTLRVDREALRQAVERDVAAVGNLFRQREEGVLPRLIRATREAIDPLTGLLAFNRRRLEALSGTDLSQQFAQSLQRAQAASLRANLLRVQSLLVVA